MKTTITHDGIKSLLLEKEELINEGREISAYIDERAREITKAEFEKLGVTATKDEAGLDYVFSGSHEALKKAYSNETMATIDSLIRAEIGEKFDRIDALETQRQAIVEKVSELVDKDILPNLDIGEFEMPKDIRFENGVIELMIEDPVAEYEANQRVKLIAYREEIKKAKNRFMSADADSTNSDGK